MSQRRARDSPVRAVELQVTLKADNSILKKISKLGGKARIADGSLSFTIGGRNPTIVAKKARKLMKIARSAAVANK